jgi:hypothetical protein
MLAGMWCFNVQWYAIPNESVVRSVYNVIVFSRIQILLRRGKAVSKGRAHDDGHVGRGHSASLIGDEAYYDRVGPTSEDVAILEQALGQRSTRA